MKKEIRPSAVGGKFYPANGKDLLGKIQKNLEAATSSSDSAVRILIVPHAGYDFSAPIAAYAYKTLSGRSVKTVVLLGSSHFSSFAGAAIDDRDQWETPLGRVAVDKKLAEKIAAAGDKIFFNSSVHNDDHVLEVQLPFLQVVLKENFKIVPIVFGNLDDSDYLQVAQALADNLSADDLVVISSDMSHYPSYQDANKIDLNTLKLIKSSDIAGLEEYINGVLNSEVSNEQTLLCSLEAVRVGMALATAKGWPAEILKYANSGDAPIANKDEVVGYGALVFKAPAEAEKLNSEQRSELLKIARTSVESYVKTGQVQDFQISDERLKKNEGVFVTLNKQGSLRGCIGQIIFPGTELWKNVRNMAVAACSEDDRFNKVTTDELPELEYEISVLSAPSLIADWKNIKLGQQGVIVSRGRNKGVFLPQVAAETGWDLEEFLGQLCSQKAGLETECYKDKNTKIEVFTADVFSEKD